jgi:catechol 2,3-dioxygenase-like lactoylglutathione lyase family enzyme
MEASAISHIAICTRDMEKSLAFYRDMLGMTVLFDGYTDPTEGGRLHNYQQARKSRRPGQPEFWGRPEAHSHPHQSPRRGDRRGTAEAGSNGYYALLIYRARHPVFTRRISSERCYTWRTTGVIHERCRAYS